MISLLTLALWLASCLLITIDVNNATIIDFEEEPTNGKG